MSGLHPTPHKGWHSRGYLPHFDRPGLIQGITFRLADSVPLERIAAWKKSLGWIEKRLDKNEQGVKPEPQNANEPETFTAQRRELHRLIAEYEDSGAGECYLKKPEIASLMVNALTCFDGQRYELKAFCIMPNHVHVLIRIFGEWTTGQIL